MTATANARPLRGQVIAVDPREGKVKVEGAAIVKTHRKAVPQMNNEGGIMEKEAWVDISNVALIDPETGKPTRVKYEVKRRQKSSCGEKRKVNSANRWNEKTNRSKDRREAEE